MSKKIFIYIVLIASLFGLPGCGASQNKASEEDEITARIPDAVAVAQCAATDVPAILPKVAMRCTMNAYAMVKITGTHPMVFVYLAQGYSANVAQVSGDQAMIFVPISGQQVIGSLPVKYLSDCAQIIK